MTGSHSSITSGSSDMGRAASLSWLTSSLGEASVSSSVVAPVTSSIGTSSGASPRGRAHGRGRRWGWRGREMVCR